MTNDRNAQPSPPARQAEVSDQNSIQAAHEFNSIFTEFCAESIRLKSK